MKNLFLVFVFLSVSGEVAKAAPDCGTSGTVEQRKADCNNSILTSAKVLWSLVSRAQNMQLNRTYEVWEDSKSGKLWGDLLDTRHCFDSSYCGNRAAVELSANNSIGRQIACTSEAAKKANAGITDRVFELPSIEDYRAAQANGMLQVLPNLYMKVVYYWSSTLFDDAHAYLFDGRGQSDSAAWRASYYSVRCIGQ